MLSPMDGARLRELDAMASYHRVACEGDGVVAFLLAFREGANYDSPNYRWFAQRYPRFLYVDRVVVAATHQGPQARSAAVSRPVRLRPHGRRGHGRVRVCTVPPNEASRRFHAAFGFREVGSQWVADGRKQVSLQVADA